MEGILLLNYRVKQANTEVKLLVARACIACTICRHCLQVKLSCRYFPNAGIACSGYYYFAGRKWDTGKAGSHCRQNVCSVGSRRCLHFRGLKYRAFTPFEPPKICAFCKNWKFSLKFLKNILMKKLVPSLHYAIITNWCHFLTFFSPKYLFEKRSY